MWAHNSHIGDARHTEMGSVRGELNIGQLCRERFGERGGADRLRHPHRHRRRGQRLGRADGGHAGRPSRPDSDERLFHDAGVSALPARPAPRQHPELRERLAEPRLERFIGVIYRPDTERWSHYTDVELPRQFDAYVWFDRTSAVTPLPTAQRPGVPETYPFGL